MSGRSGPFGKPPADARSLARWAHEYLDRYTPKHEVPLEFQADDLTDTLPGVCGSTLSETDYKKAADTLGVEVAAIKAVGKVESYAFGPHGFGPDNRPIIRFEQSWFRRLTGGAYDHTHPYLSCKDGSGYHLGLKYHSGAEVQTREYTFLYNAMILNRQWQRRTSEAIRSASWGTFQVLAVDYNLLGWKTAEDFAVDMCESELNHLRAFVSYVQRHKLAKALKDHDWTTFAAKYNGPSYRMNQYDTKLAQYYNQFEAGVQGGTAKPETP
jgi:N-acetylmuramidase